MGWEISSLQWGNSSPTPFFQQVRLHVRETTSNLQLLAAHSCLKLCLTHSKVRRCSFLWKWIPINSRYLGLASTEEEIPFTLYRLPVPHKPPRPSCHDSFKVNWESDLIFFRTKMVFLSKEYNPVKFEQICWFPVSYFLIPCVGWMRWNWVRFGEGRFEWSVNSDIQDFDSPKKGFDMHAVKIPADIYMSETYFCDQSWKQRYASGDKPRW